jgi:peptidoglycan hydrolase-like protein with peptidoglycan-binding domain
MRNALRRLAFGVLGTGMAVAATMGVTAAGASAATAAPAVTTHHGKPDYGKPPLLVWPTVMEGQYGNRVTTIQFLLNQSGFRVKADGKFGSATKKEVIAFQKASHVYPADGVVRSDTWQALILTVKQGAKGDAVRAVQSYLKYAYGYKTLKVDGVFGPLTTAAVKSFQGMYHPPLTVDGIVGTSTWHTLVTKKA